MHHLYYALRSIRRVQENSLRRPLCQLIRIQHLYTISWFLAGSGFSCRDRAMSFLCSVLLFCVISHSLGCYGFLSSRVHWHFYSMMYINLKASKTDPFRLGVAIRLVAINSHRLRPVSAMRSYLAYRQSSSGRLFVLDNELYLNRRFVASFLSIALPGASNINTHSFHIGASAALSAGASDAMIRIMGRWSSDCYIR